MNTSTKLGFASLVVMLCATSSVSALESDLNHNSTPDHLESEVIMTDSATLPAGEYTFQSLTITNSAILTAQSDPDSTDNFKGVHITAQNLTLDTDTRITTGASGYLTGPGYHSDAAASHYGAGTKFNPEWAYGNPRQPIDLGSGTASHPGAGALKLSITGTLTNNGTIDADAVHQRTSGGSVYIVTDTLTGSGSISARGGNVSWPSYISGTGGRVAVYYAHSTYTGTTSALAGDYCFYGCAPGAEHGTAMMVHTTTNDLMLPSSFVFETAHSPYTYNTITISKPLSYTGPSVIIFQPGVTTNAASLLMSGNIIATMNGVQTLNVPVFTLDAASELTVTGGAPLNLDVLNLSNSSLITTPAEHKLILDVNTLTIDTSSRIDVSGKGYLDSGPGSVSATGIGPSYGGRGANGGPDTYGNANNPDDFGSGSPSTRGGGYAHITVRDTLTIDGALRADGTRMYASGGGLLVTADRITGSGSISANAPDQTYPQYFAAGGGRVALYYDENNFTGTVTASGGRYCFYGCAPSGQDGTIVNASKPDPNAPSNVLFIPGHMGSRLYEDITDCPNLISLCGQKQLWFSVFDNLQSRMSLDANGKSIHNIYTFDDTKHETPGQNEAGILDEVVVLNIYKSFLTDMQSWKDDDIINDYAFIPYDWRLSLDDVVTNGKVTNSRLSYTTDQPFSESYILQQLRTLQRTSKSGKVTIITHSNGGLVVKALIRKLKETNDPLYNQIDQLILVASPQVGTPEAAVALLHGTELFEGYVMSTKRSRALAQNMASAYTLLPSQAYYTSVLSDIFTFPQDSVFAAEHIRYGAGVSTFAELQEYMTGAEGRTAPSFDDVDNPNISNTQLLATADTTHSVIDVDALPPNTQVIQVAGWGLETLAGLDYSAKPNSDGRITKTFNPRHTIKGDGTVVEPSALWIPEGDKVERWWVDLVKNRKVDENSKFEHKDILEVDKLREYLKSKIQKQTGYSDPDGVILNMQPKTVIPNRLHFTLHSPLTLGIRDTTGAYTGRNATTGEIDTNIPNATYGQIGDVQFLSIPDDGNYTVELDGQSTGSFSLDIERVQGDTVLDTTTYQAIPTTTDTMVTLSITPNQDIADTELRIDANGDGTTDVTLPADADGITMYDQVPPELRISFDTITRDMRVTATDTTDPAPALTITPVAITATDSAGNTTTIPRKRYRDDAKRFRIVYDSIVRNGVTTMVPQTSILYTWNVNKQGNLSDLNTRISVKGIEKYTYDYRKAINSTVVATRTNRSVTQVTLPGLISPIVTTDGMSIVINH